MTREEKCLLAIEKGFTYNPETGLIYGVRGKEINKRNKKGYLLLHIIKDKKQYELRGHQFVWFLFHKKCVDQIDHINGIKDDNRISNLRSVTNQQNHMNRTTAKGCYFIKKTNKWYAQITINYKRIHLGTFEFEEEARMAYLEAKKIYHII